VLDFAGVKDNPARDRVRVRLPREEREEPTPPTAEQIEAVLGLMPRLYALAVLVLDATGMRVGELEEKGLRCSDLDEPNAGASAAPSRKAGAAAGSHSRPTCSPPSSPRCRRARTGPRIAPCFPA